MDKKITELTLQSVRDLDDLLVIVDVGADETKKITLSTILSGYLTSESDPLSLHLDQTSPQTIINGRPVFALGCDMGGSAYITDGLLNSISPYGRYLFDGGEVESVAWGSRELIDINEYSALDWYYRELKDETGTTCVKWGYDYGAYQGGLLDSTGYLAISTNARFLANSSGMNVIDWGYQWLNDTSGYYSMDWENRYLYANNGSTIMINYSDYTKPPVIANTYTGDLKDSNNNKIADVVTGLITTVYY